MPQPNNNSIHVDPATVNMSVGQVGDIKKKAMQQVTVAEQSQREAQTNVAKSTGGAEGSVYGSVLVAAVAPGFDGILNVVGVAATRREETAQSSDSNNDFMKDSATPSGFFAQTPKETNAFDMFAPHSPPASSKVFDGIKSIADDVFNNSGFASLYLGDPINSKSWGIPPKKQDEVQEAKRVLELTYGKEIANKQALDSTLVVEKQHAAMMYQARQMAPGLGMANGPTIRPSELVSEIAKTTAA